MQSIDLYTDGSCLENPGFGGWCAILKIKSSNYEKIFSGGTPDTTNNFMELYAVCRGIEAVKKPCNITVYSDSQYICKAFNDGWIDSWLKNNWKNSKKEPVANKELWQMLLEFIKKGKHKVTFIWVKGHAENEFNNRCDEIARSEAEKAKSLIDDGNDFVSLEE